MPLRVLTHKSNAMNFFRLIGNALIASVGGFRPVLRGIANGVQDDDAATVGQSVPPVPFAFSTLIEVNDGAISGLFEVLDYEIDVPLSAIQGEEASVEGFVFYLDTQRGSYWGDIQVSVTASELFAVDIKLETIDTTECNSLVVVTIDGETTAGTSHAVEITATGGDHSITRTFTLNIEEE